MDRAPGGRGEIDCRSRNQRGSKEIAGREECWRDVKLKGFLNVLTALAVRLTG